MLRTYRYRLYPNKVQREQIRKNIDACRFVYNWALEQKKLAYETDSKCLSWYDLNYLLTSLKQDHSFLKEAYSQSLIQAIKRVILAYKHFFRRVKLGKNPGYPKFKSRKARRQSFVVPQFFDVDFEANRVCLPKIGKIKAVFHRRFTGNAKECIVVSTKTGKFFICIVVEDGKQPPRKRMITSEGSVGIDVGLTSYATLSSGEKIKNPRPIQHGFKRLRCLHKRLSRKKKGSKNREKARYRLARYYEHVANQRIDFLQKLSTRIIRENQAIIVESLNVRGMMGNRKLARQISDAAWSKFLRMLKDKAEISGVILIEIGRFESTSKLCSVCGFKNAALQIADRAWVCPECRTHHDRDINAAQNIKMIGLRSIMTPGEPREGPVELSAVAEALKQET
ncbi:MAG: RNA-guided endonuclease InsQ/TnpB family protein [Candidatus Hermodarchaeota archaeon]